MSDESPYALRLSSAESWIGCAAYPTMNQRPEAQAVEVERDNTVRDEGTAMHWAAELIQAGTFPYDEFAPNGVRMTDELIDGALFYIDVLNRYHGVKWEVETQLPANWIHAKCGGKPDAFGRVPRKIIVPDLKGGFRPVEVWPNWQLIGYAAAVFEYYGISEPEIHDYEVEFVIVQPRAFHRDGPVRNHTVRAVDLFPKWKTLADAASVAMGDNAPATTGKQCLDCNASGFCTAAHTGAGWAIEIAGNADVQNLTPRAVDYELMLVNESIRMLEARKTGLEAQAVFMLRRGERLMHFNMEQGKGRKQWLDVEAEKQAIAIGQMLGKDLAKRQTAVTPTQAEKLVDPSLIESLSHRPRGEMKLVRYDEKTAAKAFANIKKD